jgi:predicted ATPase
LTQTQRSIKLTREAMHVFRNIELRSRNGCCCEKQHLLHILNAFVALIIQHAKRLRGVILSSVSFRDLPYFAHYLKHFMIFGKCYCT